MTLVKKILNKNKSKNDYGNKSANKAKVAGPNVRESLSKDLTKGNKKKQKKIKTWFWVWDGNDKMAAMTLKL